MTNTVIVLLQTARAIAALTDPEATAVPFDVVVPSWAVTNTMIVLMPAVSGIAQV
ncbi:MAG: hypothetical protein WCS43_16905 [Verrucomicrobiota bacterium]